jgi:hypothetical protein
MSKCQKTNAEKKKEFRLRKKEEVESLKKKVQDLEKAKAESDEEKKGLLNEVKRLLVEQGEREEELQEKESWWRGEVDFLIKRWTEKERELAQKGEGLLEKERRLQQRYEERVLTVEKRKEEELRYERERWEKEKEVFQQQVEELTKKGVEVAKEVEEELQHLRAEVAEHRRNRLEVWQQWKEWDNDLEFDATKEDGEEGKEEEEEEEEDEDEMEAGGDKIEKKNEYSLEKKAAILDKLVEFAKTAFRRGKQSSVHSQVILSLFSCLPKGFVVQSLEVSSRQVSLWRRKLKAIDGVPGTVPSSGARPLPPTPPKPKKTKLRFIKQTNEDGGEFENNRMVVVRSVITYWFFQVITIIPLGTKKTKILEADQIVVEISSKKLKETAQEYYRRPGFSSLSATPSEKGDYSYSLVARVPRGTVYQTYKKENLNQPRLSRTVFYELCPVDWQDPKKESCLCATCEKGMKTLDTHLTLLQTGLRGDQKGPPKGYRIHTPQARREQKSSEEDKLDGEKYQETIKLIARLKQTNEVIEETRRSQHELTPRLQQEKTFETLAEITMSESMKSTNPQETTESKRRHRINRRF